LLFALETTGTTSSCSVSVTGSELGADSAIFLLRFVVAAAGLVDATAAGFLTTVARVARLVGGALASISGSGCTAGAAGSSTGSGIASAAIAIAAFRARTVVAGFETFVARPLLLVGLVGGLIVLSASSSTGVAMGSSVSLAAATTGFLVVRLVVLAAAVFVDFVDFVVREAGLRIDVLGIRTGTMMRSRQRDIPFCRGYCKLRQWNWVSSGSRQSTGAVATHLVFRYFRCCSDQLGLEKATIRFLFLMYIPVARGRYQLFVNARRRGLVYSPRIICGFPPDRTVIAIDTCHTVFLLFRWRIDESGLSELMRTRSGQVEPEI
jgi:hypothetical protein